MIKQGELLRLVQILNFYSNLSSSDVAATYNSKLRLDIYIIHR